MCRNCRLHSDVCIAFFCLKADCACGISCCLDSRNRRFFRKGPAVQQYSAEYVRDVEKICAMASEVGCEHLIDLACGTGFWAPHYARNCRQITFVEQSENMLSECKRRVGELGLHFTPRFIKSSFFDIELGTSAFDCAIVGFLFGHFMAEQEEEFFRKLGRILSLHGQLMIIDSVWNDKRKMHRYKKGIEKRILNDGRTFRVYKKYFEISEVKQMLENHRFALNALCAGDMLFAVIGERADSPNASPRS